MDGTRDTNGSMGQLSSAGSTSAASARMHHSQSTPAGVDGGARTPPATPKKGGKMLAVRVQMLDDTVTMFQVQAKALGKVLFDQVCKQLHLLEADYFGLEYQDLAKTRYWLDLQKPVSRQLGLSLVDPLLHFCVKFYTPDPSQLEEEFTRYLFCLQVKRDLAQGIMQCNDNTAALMASYIVQAECGDFVQEDYPDHTYLSSYKFVPHQDQELERRIMENHKKHSGQPPAEADLNLLETARRCELYGMKMHPAKDHEGVPLNLAVAHMGLVVFQHYTKINTFSWAKIRKISFKRKRFLVKLHPEGYGYYKDTVEFFFEGRNECKNFWKKCVENHGFFRCSSVKHVARHKTRVLSRGSSFRYSGKTQKQMVEFVRDNYVKRQAFQRSASFRHSSAHSSAANVHASTVGNSISAHPLLPLSDGSLSNAEVAKLSTSLASMPSDKVRAPGSPMTKAASRPQDTAIHWSMDRTTRPTNPPSRTTTSPSPPLTTQSVTPVTSTTTSPQFTYEDLQKPPCTVSSPVAVYAAVHRADTGQNIIITKTVCSHKSEGSLDKTIIPIINNNKFPSQTHSQFDLDDTQINEQKVSNFEYTYKSVTIPKHHVWQRSSSCKELYDFSFEDTGQAKRRIKPSKTIVPDKSYINLEERKLESPITRYDDSNRVLYSSTGSRNVSLEIHQDIMVPDQKVYSSSYPGTTSLSQESMEDPGNYELRDSQDDLSHDSYELLERSDDEYSTSGDFKYRKARSANTRSCSLDSGNYLPSDTESDTEHVRYKSSTDVNQDIFLMDDPRDLPREKVPRKSDGSFYKAFKLNSRTSSLESKSDYYDTRPVKSSKESLKKPGRERRDGMGSRTSSQESKSDYENKKVTRKNKSFESLGKKVEYVDSRTSSLDSKSDYYDTVSKIIDEPKSAKHEFDRKIQFERNYGTGAQKLKSNDTPERECSRSFTSKYDTYPNFKGTSHVHSISLQNVETEQNIRANRAFVSFEQNTVPRTQKSSHYSRNQNVIEPEQRTHPRPQTTYIWPESIVGIPTEIVDLPASKPSKQRSTESESNIFSFDEDKIQSLQESDIDLGLCADHVAEQTTVAEKSVPKRYRDVFMEIDTKRLELGGSDMFPLHQPIERTKSDPNNLARQRLGLISRRHTLMHQKSIDLTPAESSDEDYLYKQIPSAPPIAKYRGSHFEMPIAEFGHFDVLKREMEGQKTKFEVPKSQFEVLGAKTQSDLNNPPPKNDFDIPYILHKRHVMNGTASKPTDTETVDSESGDPDTLRQVPESPKFAQADDARNKRSKAPKSPVDPEPSSFLFTQNVDLSKIDPVTLEIDKSEKPIQHFSSPKRDITRIDPILLETLNSKLSQIESDSPTSSKTESLRPEHRHPELKTELFKAKIEGKSVVPTEKPEIKAIKPLIKDKIKTDGKPKRIIKARMQPGKKGKGNRTKVRITSFSSDDESLDSDDVFGTAEATPTKLEFSPPQTRKEMEGILKYESERKSHLQYTMSSTEVEGSPPQSRKAEHLPIDRSLDPNYQKELRRISERSISIPSSEEDFNPADMNRPVFSEPGEPVLTTVEEQIEDKKETESGDQIEDEVEVVTSPEKLSTKERISDVVSPAAKRKSGRSPLLFAHARLNLSEGSAYTMLQKQKATESPRSNRRTKSLDAPIISMNRLPSQNAFSSKDDTVEEESQGEVVSSKDATFSKSTTELPETTQKDATVKDVIKEVVEKDQIVPDVSSKGKRLDRKGKISAATKSSVTQRTGNGTKLSGKATVTTKLQKDAAKSGKSLTKPPVPARLTPKLASTSKTTTIKDKLPTQKSLPTEGSEKVLTSQKSLPTQASLTLPEIKRTKSQEMETCKKPATKEKSKSVEKLEFKRTGSRERTKSQDESDDSAKRKEKQQILYEIAVKQTLKSPVKDVLPVFPQVEESVREHRGKLEITIDTIENTAVSLEEAIIITKSPKKLDKNLTKSLELDLTSRSDNEEENGKFQRLGKSLDIEIRDTDNDQEFNFKLDTISCIKQDVEEQANVVETSPESDGQIIQEIHEAQIHHSSKDLDSDEDKTLQEIPHDNVILEGTSLDVWISVDNQLEELQEDNVDSITVLQKSDEQSFFDERVSAKPPDLVKTKSSSDSHSLEKLSLGNSLEIKYIDDSGDSSHKSEQDVTLIADVQKSTTTSVSQLVDTNRAQIDEDINAQANNTQVKITSEDESLTEVSDLKCELDNNLLAASDHRNALIKLSIERSRSEDTASWVTVECDEYLGAESFDVEEAPLDSPEKESTGDSHTLMAELEDAAKAESKPEEIKDENLLSTRYRHNKGELLKRSSDQSRSSDTTGSWTSGEKDLSPGKDQKENGDESSVSCSIGVAIGISQTIERFETREQLDNTAMDLDKKTDDAPKSPRSPRICVLGRTFTIDEDTTSNVEGPGKLSDESSSEGANDIPKDSKSSSSQKQEELDSVKYKKIPYPFEQKWSNDSELGQRVHQKISKKLSDKTSLSSLDDSMSEKRRSGKGMHSVDKLSTESRNSLDTESSSGSLGAAVRLQKSGELPLREASSTWRPFLIESSGSSSLEEGFLPTDHDFDQEYFLSRENSGDFAAMYDVACRKSDVDEGSKDGDDFQTDLNDFPTNFGYPCLTSNIGGIGIGPPDLIPSYGTSFLARTLSRISERSTNSEKSSMDEESTKASTHSDSVDESMISSDHPASLSSDPPSNAHGSDSDKKTPTNGLSNNHKKKERLPSEKNSSNNIPNINTLILHRQMSDDRRTSAEMAELSMDDIEIITSERGLQLKRQNSDDTIIDEENFESIRKESINSSQESEEWPLPDIPMHEGHHRIDRESLMALHENPSTDTSQVTTQVFKAPPICNIPKTFGHRASIKSQDSEQWPSPPSSLLETPVVGSFETYSMHPEEACTVNVDSNTVSTYDNDSVADSSEENKTLELDKSPNVERIDVEYRDDEKKSDSNSDSFSGGQSGVKIVLETKSNGSPSSNSEDFNLTLNDDVFTDTVVDVSKNELRPPTVMRRSTASDDSSHSGAKVELRPPSRKGSHSSYSDEDCTSSFGTNLEDGTVRFQLRPTKCTHSSHSEDTSIGLSLSEWSNSTNTVKLQNLSTSNSGTTKSSTNTSGGLKSDDNSLTDIAQSISEWTSSNSNSLKKQQSSNLQFQKLSSTSASTTESTLTEIIPSLSELSSSDTSTLVPQQFFSLQEYPITRLGSSFDEHEEEEEFVQVSQSVPTDTLCYSDEIKQFTKSTERPIMIPVHYLTSDTEKSTESSIEQKTVHSVKSSYSSCEKRGQKHLPSSKSTERPMKVPLKMSKSAAYYSSSLSSESAPMSSSKPISIGKTATVPLTRTHRKPMTKSMFQSKSPPSENDSTSSMDSPKSTPDSRDRVRGYRRRRQLPPKKHKTEKERIRDDYQSYYVDETLEQYVRSRELEELAECGYDFEGAHSAMYVENLEEGYFPDGDSQSGSDIFRIEGDDDNVDRYEPVSEGFDVSSIPPPLIEDDYEDDRLPEI